MENNFFLSNPYFFFGEGGRGGHLLQMARIFYIVLNINDDSRYLFLVADLKAKVINILLSMFTIFFDTSIT